MGTLNHLDQREQLIAKLRETVARVESGETVGVAWVERSQDGGYRPHWWSVPNCKPNLDGNGNFIGIECLRNGISYLAACMDHETLVTSGEASG